MVREPTDRKPTDRELALIVQIYELAELLPLSVSLSVLLQVVTMLVRGSGYGDDLWQQIAKGVEEQRKCDAVDLPATHLGPDRVQ